jgi:hypothetical protein
MPNLTGVIRQLKKERASVQGEMEQLNAALTALGSLGSVVGKSRGTREPKRRRKPMSAAARKRIAAAQRARWATWKAARRNK